MAATPGRSWLFVCGLLGASLMVFSDRVQLDGMEIGEQIVHLHVIELAVHRRHIVAPCTMVLVMRSSFAGAPLGMYCFL